MKHVHPLYWYAALAGLLIAAALVLTGCQASPAQLDGLIRAVQAATADNVVTPDEVQLIIAQLPKPGFDWVQAAEVVGSVGASILGVKFLPERHLRSPFEGQPSQPQS